MSALGVVRSTRLVLDANLLLLLVIGRERPDLLGRIKHAREYEASDYGLLCNIMQGFNELLVTPNSVTECSNLVGDKKNEDFARDSLKRLLDAGEVAICERYVRSIDAARRGEYRYLGVADCANLCLLDDRTALITCDFKLADAAKRINPESENFNHIRSFV